MQDRHESIEIALPGCSEEGIYDRSLTGEIGVGRRDLGVPDAAPGAAGELSRRHRGSTDHRRDLVEWQLEHVRMPMPGKAAAAIRAGANLAPDRAVGRTTWEDFLAARVS
jgi:hypothetical protein